MSTSEDEVWDDRYKQPDVDETALPDLSEDPGTGTTAPTEPPTS